MEYIYKFARFNVNKNLLERIDTAASRLYKKLKDLELNSMDISDYNKRYLGNKIDKIKSNLQLYAHLLALALSKNHIPVEENIFIDYGGGSGFLTLLAKEIGIKRVIYNDIYDISCKDVKLIADRLDFELSDIICGDINEVISYLKKNSIKINAIISHNVIEHIYDIEGFLRKMALLSGENFQVIHASGVNIKNPVTRYYFTKIHRDREYKNRDKKWGHKERDTLRSYFSVRQDIITNYASDLKKEEIEKLARLTRGLNRTDIESSIKEYIENGEISYYPSHPTNTCDPYTGNRADHFMQTEWLEGILEDAGFDTKVSCGYMDSDGILPFRITKYLFNIIISLLGRKAMVISPYYVLQAELNS